MWCSSSDRRNQHLPVALVLLQSTIGCAPSPSLPGASFDAGALFAEDAPSYSHRFEIKNTTGRIVRLLGERHSCDCMSVELPEPPVLEPGASGTLELHARVPSGRTERVISCVLLTDHPQYPEWTYSLSFESFPRSRFVPDRVDLGDVTSGTAARVIPNPGGPDEEIWWEAYARTPDALAVPGRLDIPPDLRADLDRTPRVERLATGVWRSRCRLGISVAPDHIGSGSFAEPITVTASSGESASILVAWRTVGSIAVVPPRLHFGVISPDVSSETKRVSLASTSDEPFRITAVAADATEVRLDGPSDWKDRKATHHELSFSYTGGGSTSDRTPHSGLIHIETGDEDGGMVAVPWSVFVRRAQSSPGTEDSPFDSSQPRSEER